MPSRLNYLVATVASLLLLVVTAHSAPVDVDGDDCELPNQPKGVSPDSGALTSNPMSPKTRTIIICFSVFFALLFLGGFYCAYLYHRIQRESRERVAEIQMPRLGSNVRPRKHQSWIPMERFRPLPPLPKEEEPEAEPGNEPSDKYDLCSTERPAGAAAHPIRVAFVTADRLQRPPRGRRLV